MSNLNCGSWTTLEPVRQKTEYKKIMATFRIIAHERNEHRGRRSYR